MPVRQAVTVPPPVGECTVTITSWVALSPSAMRVALSEIESCRLGWSLAMMVTSNALALACGSAPPSTLVPRLAWSKALLVPSATRSVSAASASLSLVRPSRSCATSTLRVAWAV